MSNDGTTVINSSQIPSSPTQIGIKTPKTKIPDLTLREQIEQKDGHECQVLCIVRFFCFIIF